MTEQVARVLIVDDDPDIVRMLEKILGDYEVLTSSDGTEALEIIRREDVHVVLADQMMPDLTGVELLRQTQDLRPHAARILITASDRITDASDAINHARVHRFICKPVRAVELKGVVSSALRERALESELQEKNQILRRALNALQAHERHLQRELELRTHELEEIKAEFARLGFGPGRTRHAVLLVGSDGDTRADLRRILSSEAYDVEAVETLAEAKERWAREAVDLIVAEETLRDGRGIELAQHATDCEVILVGPYSSVETVVRAMTLNVADYFVKPLGEPEELQRRVHRVLRSLALRRHERETLVQLQELVTRDPLTGLFNHGHFQEALDRELLRAKRHGHEVSLVLVDIDDFRRINDAVGHSAGDSCLKAVAKILMGTAKIADARFRLRGQDTAARFGGDEFALILPETPKIGAAVKAEQLRAFVERYDCRDVGIEMQTVSIGIAGFPEDAQDRVGLIEAADAALHAAKLQGRSGLVTYVPQLASSNYAEQRRAADEELQLMAALDRTIRDRHFHFAFQPIVHTATHEVLGYEALCRPTDEAFPDPGALFNTAERAGRVIDLGRACRVVAASALEKVDPSALLFVNLHPHELNDSLITEGQSDFVAHAGQVVFEITETAAISDSDRLRKVMSGLRERGYRLALDDLGAGYAGLNSLALLQPDFVKLDITLIRQIEVDGSAARLIKHILEYAEGEGMQVIAEGVETTQELEAVRRLGCPLAQGYLLARPGPPFPTVEPRTAMPG
ncbi:MAG: EAL domain-containing protein [Deltaproteobacteria bacterium]|jgi:diguanylate cyclase (GGDEF)-like protein|nr:EAL domain-containing protein [Deltaproteobacteria bacterium]MBW2536245.1 EAL domain-containing protein [Deltaproteobacteria bacterium]